MTSIIDKPPYFLILEMEKLPVNNILINNMKRIRDSDKLINISCFQEG